MFTKSFQSCDLYGGRVICLRRYISYGYDMLRAIKTRSACGIYRIGEADISCVNISCRRHIARRPQTALLLYPATH